MKYEIFEQLCKKHNVRPVDVSKATGVSTSTLSAWKTGLYEPKTDKLQKIADYFGVSVDYLMTGKTGYYINPETAEKAQLLFDDPDMRLLFDAAKDSRPEDLQMAADLLKRLKETNKYG